jgi:hypothetical protein
MNGPTRNIPAPHKDSGHDETICLGTPPSVSYSMRAFRQPQGRCLLTIAGKFREGNAALKLYATIFHNETQGLEFGSCIKLGYGFRYAPERPMTGKVRVARYPGGTR